ncbi:MGT family glycosyltransferase [Streptomyces kunmingensis]|uniref:MGT family glycosyltransferase n=1 Tax=Streptomyces kunmingensis TaxID=68225 RepID=A0ABU6C4J4_9ACTN|nr:macrolide family glycosyltransferase [Streptomyces kunmingensis]MEB3959102.1 MGT family glycosyltransferase [Streptomyces kunmingensis]
MTAADRTGPHRHLAFLPYPAYGHMVPVLPVVAELVERGHRVTCFTTEEFTDRVLATGARPCLYDPPLSSDPPPDVIDADECARAPLKLLEASTAVLPAVEACFADGPPDAVAYDTTLWLTGRLLAARWGRPSVQLSPTFISNEHFNLSDQHTEFAGEIDPAHPAIVAFGERLKEIVTGSGLAPDRQAELFYGHEEFTVAFVPKEFQFAGGTFDERHVFVGPTTPVPAAASAGTAWRPPADGRPVLLVSLGTTVNNRPEFFRQCVEAFAGLPWHIVLALGKRVRPEELGELPPHVEAHPWVPLPEVLAHTSVLLCQSGMGSIMESLRAAVPMVVVPHHPEQHVNARRLTDLGLARVVRREDATAQRLRDAVQAVAGDTALRERVREMSGHVRSAGGAARAADAIEQRLHAPSLEAR